jgi:hypothetical protein
LIITGITGKIVVDRFGERISEFVLHDLNPDTEEFEPIISSVIYNKTESVLQYNSKQRPIYWYKHQTGYFPDSPRCGFNRAKCPVKRKVLSFYFFFVFFLVLFYCFNQALFSEPLAPWVWIAISMAILIFIMLVISIVLYRKLKFEAELKAMNWLIKWEDIRAELVPADDAVIVSLFLAWFLFGF